MAQPPPYPPTGFHTRAMTEVRNPVYAYEQNGADFKRMNQPQHVLERPPPVPANVDARLSVQGDTSRAPSLTPLVGMAYQTPYNVWALYPA
jgi:hypothetical protein